MTSRPAPPPRPGTHRAPAVTRTALAELDRLWQRGPAGQLLLLVTASSVLVTALLLAAGLAALAGS